VEKRHVLEDVVARSVAARDGQRAGGRIRCEHIEVRKFARQRHGDRAAPGADVGDASRFAADRAQVAHCPFDRDLRLRPRHQNALVDREHPAVKPGLAGYIRQRLSRLAPRDERREALRDRGVERASGVGEHLLTRDAAGVREQKGRIEPAGSADRFEPHRGIAQRFADRHLSFEW
jgi:hypothetical protein